MEQNVEELRQCLLNSMPTLFLGAGFSREAVCVSGVMPTGKELKNELFGKFIEGKVDEKRQEQIEEYNLRELCDCIDGLVKNGKEERENFLTERLKGAWPNEAGYHRLLAEYPWKRIYTVNIDDLVEHIYEKADKKYKSIYSRKDIPERTEEMELIKLHGCVRHPDEGYIFSKKEYNVLINQKINLALTEFTNEIYSSNDIILIGASLDEPDLEYYLQLYEDMRFERKKSRMFFIEPSPSLALEQRAKQLQAIIIEWTTEQFLKFVADLHYNPDKMEHARLELNRNMIYRLRDDVKIFKEEYDSNIYQGAYCTWQDVFEKWTFEYGVYERALVKLDHLLKEPTKVKCFCVYGSSFVGKSTLQKQLGYYLYGLNYEVLEYKGRYLNKEVIERYIRETDFGKYAVLIDNASFYYSVIERMLEKDYGEEGGRFLCASRTYYHKKKRYYLVGNCFAEYDGTDSIKRDDAKKICKTLEDNHALGYMYDLKNPEDRVAEITRKKSVINLIVDLTYGNDIRKKMKKEMRSIKQLSDREQELLLEIAIFNSVDIEYYPMELFVEKYGQSISISTDDVIGGMKIADYIKYDEQGISLKNLLLQEEVLNRNVQEKYYVVENLLKRISRYVHEGNKDIWTIIFQSLHNEKQLRNALGFSNHELQKLFYGLKEEYKEISYYWLQLGLFEQSRDDYAKALSHLKKSQFIQPRSFKIQHAIARNYLKFANNQQNFEMARPLFDKGEKLMKQLIDSNEYYIKKAKPFSVNSYVLEKVRYIERYEVKVSTKELCELRDMLDKVYSDTETYIRKAMQSFYRLLQKLNKQSLIRMNFNNGYYAIMGENLSSQEDMTDDIY